jgi:hypothetical protein
MSSRGRAACSLAAMLALAWGCEQGAVDPPLPPPKFEIAAAPPGALGAKAAGTDAAPLPPEDEQSPWPADEEPAPALPDPHHEDGKPRDRDAGTAADAGGLPL